jgi:hypothetical protein
LKSVIYWTFILLGFGLAAGLACYDGHGLDPGIDSYSPTGIKGHVTFTGAWPDSTREVHIAALRTYPKGMHDPDSLLTHMFNEFLAGNLVFSDTIPEFTLEYDYELLLSPGLWEWVIVAWFPDINDYFFGVKELGAYYTSSSGTDPAPVSVIPGTMIEGIDIIADFANVDRTSPFFKSREPL